MRKYYPGITLFKLIGCLLVLFGHVRLPVLYAQLSQHIVGLQQAMAFTVPCFYMISGFLAYKGWTGTSHPGRYIRHYVGWVGGFYLLLCVVALATNTGTELGKWLWPIRNMVVPLLKVYLVLGPYPSLWFIPPLLFGILVCYGCHRAGHLSWAVWLGVVGFVLAQLLNGTLRQVLHVLHLDTIMYHTRYGYADLLAQTVSNFFGAGLPFVLAGVLVARHEERFYSLPGWRLAALALGSLAVEYAVLRWLAAGNYQFALVISMVPIGLWLFYGVLHIQSTSIQKHHALINRFSIVLYFLHILLLQLNTLLLGQSWKKLFYINWHHPVMTPGQSVLYLLLTLAEAALLTLLLHTYLNRRHRARLATAPAPPADKPIAAVPPALRPAPARAR